MLTILRVRNSWRAAVLRETPYLCVFLPLGILLGSQVNSQERSHCDSGKVKRKVSILKYTQSMLHNKDLLPWGKNFYQSFFPPRGRAFP